MEKIELKPGEICPCCGQRKRGGWKNPASAKNGLKGGKPRNLRGGRPKKNPRQNMTDEQLKIEEKKLKTQLENYNF